MPDGDISGPHVWYGSEMAQSDEWIHEFSESDIAEIDTALRQCTARGLDTLNITPEEFSLPGLTPQLLSLRNEILRGRGFVLLRGLPVEHWSRQQVLTVYWGLACHIGYPLSQNVNGHMIDHVHDSGRTLADCEVRAYQTSIRMSYHTDMACDVVGLLCLSTSEHGGLSTIVSGATLFNEIRRRDPELCEVLFEPFWFDRRAEIPEGKLPYFPIPLFNYFGGTLSVVYSPIYIESAQQRFPEVPRLTDRQKTALELLERTANNPSISLAMDFKPGDIQLINNFTTMHARTAFKDGTKSDAKRHLLRIWLCVPDGLPSPESTRTRRLGCTPTGTRPQKLNRARAAEFSSGTSAGADVLTNITSLKGKRGALGTPFSRGIPSAFQEFNHEKHRTL